MKQLKFITIACLSVFLTLTSFGNNVNSKVTIAELQKQLDEAKSKKEELAENLKEISKNLLLKDKELSTIKDDLSNVAKGNTNLSTYVLKTDLMAIENKNKDIESQITLIKSGDNSKVIKGLKELIKTAKITRDNQLKWHSIAKGTYLITSSDKNIYSTILTDIENVKKDILSKETEVKVAKVKLVDEKDKYDKELKQIQSKSATLTAENNRLKQDAQRIKAENERIKKQINGLYIKEIDDYKKSIKKIEDNIVITDKYKNKIKVMNSELDNLKSLIDGKPNASTSSLDYKTEIEKFRLKF
ncbi:coiled-coil domain-containing protein [Flammeovirga kamogawensis]|uniref:Peptidase M23 n=1 Tax=Flammeovirga kamogawensis TaxID=373891 RepID=A0ABX8GXF7_9BACT|nr:hypothetical protein [Flammeovirga kamogawensis]MBB6460948.1 uncharacterized protein (DUF3084 family) [Flammeovirga kamogawensis]QWG08290.1 hypothetical protein KM029_04965 [Flammeovirga kamogawensis]TRX66589.1 hypothetical protein EO216_00035 [Flammeovirga kamogawensis]